MARWKAVYNDGTFLNQYNNDGSENKYSEIDRANLSQFLLLRDTKELMVIIYFTRPSQKLIYRKRVAIYISGSKTGTQDVVYIVGWHENRNGTNVQMICFVFDDGHVEILDRFDKNHNWFYPIIFMEEEKL